MENEMLKFRKNSLLGKINGQPLCCEYNTAWRKCGNDKEMLMKLALSQQSLPYLSHACYEHMGLSKGYILSNFGEFINGKRTFNDVEGVNGYTYQMYVGYSRDFDITADITNIMWCNSPQIVVNASKCPTIYISNKSDVHLVCDGCNYVNIKLFDESKVTIEDAPEDSKIIIYKYSDDCEVKEGKFNFSEIKEFRKELRL